MNNLADKSRHILNDLIEICKDGQHGFQTAADDAKDESLLQLFRQYSTERTRYIAELQERVRDIGGEPDKHGTVTGTLHRGWINIKAAVSSNEPHAVLAECERGEDAAVKAYREALAESELDPESRRVIQKQAEGVQAAHDKVKQLRDSQTYAQKS
ncbi:MAG: PA2169 family four-helix-bundle protein [Opitutaceae bacterium]